MSVIPDDVDAGPGQCRQDARQDVDPVGHPGADLRVVGEYAADAGHRWLAHAAGRACGNAASEAATDPVVKWMIRP